MVKDCNLHYDSWSKVLDAMVKGLEERVKGCFVLDMELEKQRNALEYQLNLCYNRQRSRLHLYGYKIYFKDVDSQDLAVMVNAKVEVRANVPPGIASEQWPAICDSFEIDSWKKKSKQNKKNRSKMQTNHTAGTLIFVNAIYKKRKIT